MNNETEEGDKDKLSGFDQVFIFAMAEALKVGVDSWQVEKLLLKHGLRDADCSFLSDYKAMLLRNAFARSERLNLQGLDGRAAFSREAGQ